MTVYLLTYLPHTTHYTILHCTTLQFTWLILMASIPG